MVSEAASKMFIFTVTFAMVFGVFGMAFTTFVDTEIATGGLSKDDLLKAGIFLTESETFNVTSNGGWVTYSLHEYDVRVRWYGVFEQVFEYQRQNTWISTLWTPCYVDRDGSWYANDRENWVTSDFNSEYNWTHRTVTTYRLQGIGGVDSIDVFYQITPGYSSIEDSIINDTVTITVGRGMGETPSWIRFIGWYVGMSFPTNLYGFPWYLSLVLMLVNAMVVVSLYQMIRG